MAAIEDILGWAKQEQSRLAHELEQLLSGRLRTYEKHAQSPGWLEIDTTDQSITRCREYISELNAIVARYPQIVPTQIVPPRPQPVKPPAVAPEPTATPVPRTVPPVAPHANLIEHGHLRVGRVQHPGWVQGWGVVKGQPPRWQLAGVYESHAEANEAVAEAGEGYYARWGSYNEQTKEFTSGPVFGDL
jgi:hypothetical protein